MTISPVGASRFTFSDQSLVAANAGGAMSKKDAAKANNALAARVVATTAAIGFGVISDTYHDTKEKKLNESQRLNGEKSAIIAVLQKKLESAQTPEEIRSYTEQMLEIEEKYQDFKHGALNAVSQDAIMSVAGTLNQLSTAQETSLDGIKRAIDLRHQQAMKNLEYRHEKEVKKLEQEIARDDAEHGKIMKAFERDFKAAKNKSDIERMAIENDQLRYQAKFQEYQEQMKLYLAEIEKAKTERGQDQGIEVIENKKPQIKKEGKDYKVTPGVFRYRIIPKTEVHKHSHNHSVCAIM